MGMRLVAAVVLWSSIASAEYVPVPPEENLDPVPPVSHEVDPPKPPPFDYEGDWRMLYELFWRHGGPSLLGTTSDSKNAFGIAAGIHRDRIAFLAEYSLGGMGYHPMLSPARGDVTIGSDGLIHRLGAVARFAYAKGQSDVESGGFQGLGDLFVDAGAGVEMIRWDDGGTLVRPDLSFGLGGETGFRVSPHQRGTLEIALRVHVARRSDRDGLADTCSAPCSWPSAPTAWSDRSYMLELGYTFGP